MANERDKRGVFESDDDRALKRERQRATTRPEGVPIEVSVLAKQMEELGLIESAIASEADDYDDEFTPVSEILPIAKTPESRAIVIQLWKHSADQELRFRRTRNRSSEQQLRNDLDSLIARVEGHSERIVDATGKSGDNGKLGELRRRVDAWTSKLWWCVTAAVGAIGTAAIKLVLVTRAFDAVESRSLHNAEQVKILQAQVMTLQAAAISRRAHRAEPGPTEPAVPEKD